MKKFFKWAAIVFGSLILLTIIWPKSEKAETNLKESILKPTTEDIEVLKTSANYEPSMGMYTIHVTLKNNSSKLVTAGSIKAVIYDKENNVVGTASGSALNIPSGKSKVVDCIGMNIEGANRYEIEKEFFMYE